MFVVLTDSRTGSHLLRSLLNSHPDLTCYDEILGLRKHEKDFYSLGENEGCLVAYTNLILGNKMSVGNDVDRIAKIIFNTPVIHLTRDLEERARSQLFYSRAKKRHKAIFRKANLYRDASFNKSLDDPDPMELKLTEEIFAQNQQAAMRMFRSYRQDWLELDYQWLCGGEQIKELEDEKAKVICDYLNVPVTKLTTNLYKIRKFG